MYNHVLLMKSIYKQSFVDQVIVNVTGFEWSDVLRERRDSFTIKCNILTILFYLCIINI